MSMLVEKVKRCVVYFRRGWMYVALAVQFINFVIISFQLLVRELLHLDITYIVPYSMIVGLLAISLCIVIGLWDYRRGTWRHEAVITMLNNPIWRDVLQALYYLSRGENEKATQILRKYVK